LTKKKGLSSKVEHLRTFALYEHSIVYSTVVVSKQRIRTNLIRTICYY